jgi:hypothetical protein
MSSWLRRLLPLLLGAVALLAPINASAGSALVLTLIPNQGYANQPFTARAALQFDCTQTGAWDMTFLFYWDVSLADHMFAKVTVPCSASMVATAPPYTPPPGSTGVHTVQAFAMDSVGNRTGSDAAAYLIIPPSVASSRPPQKPPPARPSPIPSPSPSPSGSGCPTPPSGQCICPQPAAALLSSAPGNGGPPPAALLLVVGVVGLISPSMKGRQRLLALACLLLLVVACGRLPIRGAASETASAGRQAQLASPSPPCSTVSMVPGTAHYFSLID